MMKDSDMNQTSDSLETLCTQSPLPEQAFLDGVCFREREPQTIIDTIIIHSCHVPDGVRSAERALINEAKSNAGSWENAVKGLSEQWKKTADTRFEFAALLALLEGRAAVSKDATILQQFSVAGVKCLFEFYGVSAHFIVDRSGKVFQLINPEQLAFHAGVSKIPHDGRERANGFSIGIELLADESSGYTAEQTQSLVKLCDALTKRFPIEAIYGHSDIAPGRKTDPWEFKWQSFLGALARAPKFHP